MLYDIYKDQQVDDSLTSCLDDDTDSMYRVGWTFLGDYTLGGSMAGFMLSSLTRQTSSASRLLHSSAMMPRLGLAAGMGFGTALGLVAGGLQGAIAVGEVYVYKQQQLEEKHVEEAGAR